MNIQSFEDAERIFNTSYRLTNNPKLLPLVLKKLHESLNENTELSMELQQLISKKKSSSVEFTRNDKRIFCDENYNLTIIDPKIVEEYLQKTKLALGA